MLGVFSSSLRKTTALRFGLAPLALAACLMAPASARAQEAEATGELEKWVDETGSFQIEAKFVKLDGANVVLVSSEGKQLNVPYAKLSLSSQLKAKKAADPKAFVPPELPSAYAPPPLAANPFPEDPTIEQFIDTFRAEVKAEHADVLWYAMPADMQSEVEKIVIKVVDILGPKTFKQLQAVMPNLLAVIRDQRSMILGNQRIARQPELAKEVAQALQTSQPLVEALARPTTWSSQNFQPGKVGPWLVALLNDLAKSPGKFEDIVKPMLPDVPAPAAAANNQAANQGYPPPGQGYEPPGYGQPAGAPAKPPRKAFDWINAKYKVIEKTTDMAKVEFQSADGTKTQVTFKKVERTWLPQTFADNWQGGVTAVRGALDGMDKAAIDQTQEAIKTGLRFVNGVVGAVAKARNQQEFDQMADPLLAQVEQMYRLATGGAPGQYGYGDSGYGQPYGQPGYGADYGQSSMPAESGSSAESMPQSGF